MPTFTPPHRDLTFLSPPSEARAARLVAFLAEDEPATALDAAYFDGYRGILRLAYLHLVAV